MSTSVQQLMEEVEQDLEGVLASIHWEIAEVGVTEQEEEVLLNFYELLASAQDYLIGQVRSCQTTTVDITAK